MKKIKLPVMLLLCLVLLFSLTACGGGTGDAPASTTPPASGGEPANPPSAPAAPDSPGTPDAPPPSTPARDTLNLAVSQDTGTLEPIGLSGNYLQVGYCYMEPLWDVTADNETIWILATGVDEVSPTQLTIHIREGVKFSNGNPLTASDVLFTLNKQKENFNTIMNAQSLDLENSKVIDDLTLDLRYEDHNVAWKTILSVVLVCDEESYDAQTLSLHPIGTGPYTVTEYVVNSHCFLERREDYWGEKPTIKYIKFRVFNESAQIVNAIATNLIDIGTIPLSDFEYVSSLPGFDVTERASGAWMTIGFNVSTESVFNNVEARYAVCHAMDRNAMVALAYEGHGGVMSGPTPTTAFDYEPRFSNMHETYSIGYDPALAKQYADSSGLTGKEVRVMTNGAAEDVAIAQILQGQLSAIGVTVKIITYDNATFRAMADDATAFDIRVGMSASPNNITPDGLVNGVRYSKIWAEGNWEGVAHYLEIAPSALSDSVNGPDITYELLQMYTKACLSYGICDIVSANAISKDLDASGAAYRANGALRFTDLKFK
jgi:peptide/nickel transport system substrate-binding protein